MQEPFLWGEGGKGEGRRASRSSGPRWAWGIRATCLLSDIKYSMSFLQVPAPSLAGKGTKAHLPPPHPFSPWILFKLLFTVPGVGTSQETTQASAPGLGPQHLSPPLSMSSESTYTLIWGLICSPNSRAICSAFKNTQYGDGKGDLNLPGCVNGFTESNGHQALLSPLATDQASGVSLNSPSSP